MFQVVKSVISGFLEGSFQCSVIKCSVKHWDGGGWGKLVRLEVNSGAHGVTRPTIRGWARRWMIVGAFMDVSSCKKCYFGVFGGKFSVFSDQVFSRRESRAMPRLKVPAPQANRVAARPGPPQESGAGMVVRWR